MKPYPWKALPQLSSYVENGQRKEAHQALQELLDVISNQKSDLMFCKLRCSNFLIGCTRGAYYGGVPNEKVLNDYDQMLRRIVRLRSWRALQKEMHRFLDNFLDLVRPLKQTSIEHKVAEIRQQMRTSLEEPRSLAEYANQWGMSVGHLSRCFTATVGHPFREELRRVRIETACKLLKETHLKMSAICRKLGLQDPSQFIADFRREMGMTPASYRKRHQPRPRSVPLL